MSSLKRFVLPLMLIILLSGCLKVETTINVNTDGSGTIVETVMLSSEFADMIEEFSQSFDENAEKEEFSLFNEEDVCRLIYHQKEADAGI